MLHSLDRLARADAPGTDQGRREEAAAPLDEAGDDSDSDSDSTTAASDGDAAKLGAGHSDIEEVADSCTGTAASSSGLVSKGKTREMVTKRHRKELTKEGYKIIGSHSAVKLCRWTKHQLRGRGGCYKHSFYGITSFQCMEATPSLACANKCVFCWRHHKNPTGTEWKWKMDEPEAIVAEGIEQHQKMIKECKGIPGVKPERWQAAMQVRHCALSLVGEPIMYPRINELLADLHRRKISTFLVTNAQFPEAIEQLCPVTQLYVSIDAGTPDALKKVDRPIFTDFWDRYLDSLRALAKKKQRTTYRLTLVKDHNMADAEDYARLVALGDPDLIEIKSVTFCGESKASSLTMGNVPWHEEVRLFAERILSHEGLSENYELACEHQHSCIVLIAHKRFKIQGSWHTWIDYDRFHELVAEGSEFSALDYAAPTPAWALYGSEEHGFDPQETRVFHNRTKRKAKEGLLSEAQLRNYPHNPAQA
uniref:tRNA 4-demethylwyosine synthase (AdoMet-dependent) n=1 Tax=Zooxanthella nutricula TaxID=1333877 RepID=A0A7S2QDT2_9DINO